MTNVMALGAFALVTLTVAVFAIARVVGVNVLEALYLTGLALAFVGYLRRKR